VAGAAFGLVALSTCIGLITPPPQGRGTTREAGGAAAAVSEGILDSETSESADEVDIEDTLVAERAVAERDGSEEGVGDAGDVQEAGASQSRHRVHEAQRGTLGEALYTTQEIAKYLRVHPKTV
jgi:hypothetical protein